MLRIVSLLSITASLSTACGGESSSGDGASGASGSAGSSGSSGDAGSSGSSVGGAAGIAGTGPGGAPSGGAAGSGTGGSSGDYSLSIGPINVDSGKEDTRCVVKRLSNADPIKVGTIHDVISGSSHHMIVYRTTDTQEQTQPFACTPFASTLDPSKGAPMVITQKHDDLLQLPPGVAFSFAAQQMFRLELHYINTTNAAVDVDATASFTVVPDAEVQNEAELLFIGSLDVDIPAYSTATLGPTFFALPSEVGTPSVFAITGHTHAFGTNVTVASAPSASGPDTTVYDVADWSWSDPETVMHDPPFQVASGGGGFRFTCEWDNTSPKRVSFGESATAEMCFFWAYYYPTTGAKVCFHTTKIGFPIDACCPGSAYCSLLGF